MMEIPHIIYREGYVKIIDSESDPSSVPSTKLQGKNVFTDTMLMKSL